MNTDSGFGELMRRAGPPTMIIIYPDADRIWRFAIYHAREIADGYLNAAPAATPDHARAAAETLIRQICERYHQATSSIAWEPPDDKGMISGQVTTAAVAP
jgi:hypothetical protein